ncbi:hypothetical protein [Parabacteroides sp.]
MNKGYQALNRIAGRLVLLVSSLLIITSCTDESFVGDGNGKYAEERMAVRLTINTPSTQNLETSNQDREVQIEKVRILILSKSPTDLEYKFLYSMEGTNINRPNSYTTTFSVMLKSSKDPIKLILIANANQVVEEKYPDIGDSETQVKEKLIYELKKHNGNPEAITGYLPMYGEYTLPELEAGKVNENIRIKMLRSVARADVYNNDATKHFTLESVQVFRSYNMLQLIPNNITGNSEGGMIVDTPSLPLQSTFFSVDYPMPLRNPEAGETFIEQIYLPEAPAPATDRQISDATCLVVGGIYDDGIYPAKTVYYRIDFRSPGEPFGQILRNYRYTFIIQKVSGLGWDTPEEAAQNAPSGMIATVESWDEHTTDMYFDGQHHYGVSSRHVKLQYRENSQEIVYIDTDLTGEVLQWVDAEGNPVNNDEPSISLSSDRFEVSLVEKTDADNNTQKQLQIRTRQENNSYSDYSEYVMIYVNRWKILITVTQSSNRNRNEIIHVLSSDEIGGLHHSSSKAMRAILDNHFGPGKTIQLGGIEYTSVTSGTAIKDALTYDKLAQQDIVVLSNNTRPDSATARRVLDWLGARKNRVLILGFDWKDPSVNDTYSNGHPEHATTTNYQVLKLLRDDVTPYWYNGGTNASIGDTGPVREDMIASFDIQANNSYFFRTGPFTAPQNIEISSCGYWLEDIYWGRMEVHNPDIVPLIVFKNVVRDDGSGRLPAYTPTPEGDGRMIVGIDKKKRIVYVGDSQFFGVGTGNEVKKSSRIDNINGNLTNNYSRIMANLWAWMIEEVVLGNNE